MIGFASLALALAAAFADAETLAPKHEAGGAVYQCGAAFYYAPPTTDGKREGVTIRTGTVEGCALAAVYHTHPRGDARMSGADIAAACTLQAVSWVKPKGGEPFSFDCRGKSAGAIQAAIRGRDVR